MHFSLLPQNQTQDYGEGKPVDWKTVDWLEDAFEKPEEGFIQIFKGAPFGNLNWKGGGSTRIPPLEIHHRALVAHGYSKTGEVTHSKYGKNTSEHHHYVNHLGGTARVSIDKYPDGSKQHVTQTTGPETTKGTTPLNKLTNTGPSYSGKVAAAMQAALGLPTDSEHKRTGVAAHYVDHTGVPRGKATEKAIDQTKAFLHAAGFEPSSSRRVGPAGMIENFKHSNGATARLDYEFQSDPESPGGVLAEINHNKKFVEKKDFTEEQRSKLAHSGKAMPDGSYPITDAHDLHSAIDLVGVGNDPEGKIKAHIISRAKDLKLESELPQDWVKKLED